MNNDLVRRLLLYIVDQLQDRESPISTIRLVKFLYLIDLEYYTRHHATLTGIDWVKYKFGPYFFALPETIRSTGLDLEIQEVETERGKGRTFRVFETQDISKVGPYAVGVMINNILDKWADEDTPVLLDHVYETLPVKYGSRGQPLDFTLETDHLLLKQARETATDFLTIDELLTDYEENAATHAV
jgi:hypothetical protein